MEYYLLAADAGSTDALGAIGDLYALGPGIGKLPMPDMSRLRKIGHT
jgi:hypothetical protein